MEARSFFENGPMAEITVSATKEEWMDLLTDIDAFVGCMMDNDFVYHSLEPGTEKLIEALKSQGVTL